MTLGFRGKKFGARLLAILCISLFVVVVQILTVSRLSIPNRYPWEEDELKTVYHRPEKEEHRRGVRNTLEEQLKPPVNEKSGRNSNGNIDHSTVRTLANTSKPHPIIEGVTTQESKTKTDSTQPPSQSPPKPSPQCQPQAKDAISALERAKSAECKLKIHETICLAQENRLYNTSIKNECPLGRNPTKQFQHVPYDQGQGPLPRVVFLLSIHGRAVRQVKRVFKAIYHSNHYYYIHVDYHSDYLYEELKLAFKEFSNVYIPDSRMATIWGGASLLQMLLRALEDLEYLLTNWKWDYFINLSESDYPLKTNEELVQFLRVHRKFNFVKTHGGDIKKFIQKQGLDRTFVECDYHMWRIGNRELPPDITIDGGSDWIVINRNYSHYLVTNQDPFLKGLKLYYQYSLLPAESFFHTVLRNGPLCDTMVRSNLRITNWNRKLGCRCQYKHVVDWCGCSPNDFLNKDLEKLRNPKDDQFFARKFEAIVNQNVITELDAHLYGKYPEDTPGLNSYWESLFHHQFDAKPSSSAHYTVYSSFLRLSTKLVTSMENGNQSKPSSNCIIPITPTVTETLVYYEKDEFVGYVVRYHEEKDTYEPSSLHFESIFVPIIHRVSGEAETCPQLRSSSIEIGSAWDGKESIFRNYGGILGIYDEPAVAIRMKIGRMCRVEVFWVNPLGMVEQKNDLKLEASATVAHQKLNLELPIMPGKWTLRLISSSTLFVEQQFVVFPVMFDKDKPLADPTLVNGKHVTVLKAGMDPQKYMEWRINVLKKGVDLQEWLDKLVSEVWSLKSTCAYFGTHGNDGSCRTLQSCETSHWSGYYPDTKSELGPVNAVGRIR